VISARGKSTNQSQQLKRGRNNACACGSGKKFKKCCGGVTAEKPRDPQDLRPLSLLLQQGQFGRLEAVARQFLIEQPDNGAIWKLLAMALFRQGKDAFEALEKSAALLPDDAEAHCNLGNALRRRGRIEEAIASQARALAINPGYAQALNDLGVARFELGQFREAIASYRQAIKLKPDLALASVNLGRALLQIGDAEEAARSLRRATDLEPGSAIAHWVFGNALVELGRAEEAAVQYQRTIALKPDFATAHSNLGCVLRDLGQPDAAASSFMRALQLMPEQSEVHNNLGIVLRLLHRYEEAADSATRAHELNPASAAPLIALAKLKADGGDFTEAEGLLRRALAVDPDSAEACSAIPGLRQMNPDDAEWFAGAQRIAARELPARQRAHLHYAMGKYCDDVGDFSRAFSHYQRANDLKKSHSPGYDRGQFHGFVTRLLRSASGEWVNWRRDPVEVSTQPIFIVGMPRSGTSLSEQILASHPMIRGAGELAYWGQALAGWAAQAEAGHEDEQLHALGAQYLQRIGSEVGGTAHIVDKMPANFLGLGLIHAALPNARIIHMRRDPVDTCLSVYFQDFEASYNYANDLEDLAHYYEEYSRLMQHWREVLPAQALLEVPYEELVSDTESWSRRMLEFVGVGWDPQCLEFHRTRRAVITASKWQVRQKVNARSVGRWRNYEPHLGPLRRLQRNA
jgi:tetratricopeptide (TPR) repeat protein